jgi:phosphoribosylformylglycinamidine (FGAM) synthase PurS component
MNPVTAIRKMISPTNPATPKPALAALRAHLDVDQGIVKQIAAINVRMRSVDDDIRRADESEARQRAQEEAIDQTRADAKYSDQPPPDLKEAYQKLSDLKQKVISIGEIARVGRLVRLKLQADTDALLQRRRELKHMTDRLLWNAAREEADARVEDYRVACDQVTTVAHKLFAARTAADTIARARGFGEFYGDSYQDLHLPLLLDHLGPEDAQRERVADALLISHEAEDVLNFLLNGI